MSLAPTAPMTDRQLAERWRNWRRLANLQLNAAETGELRSLLAELLALRNVARLVRAMHLPCEKAAPIFEAAGFTGTTMAEAMTFLADKATQALVAPSDCPIV